MHVLEAIGPIDGRYRNRFTAPLAEHFSELSLMRYRLVMEAEYLLALSQHPQVPLRPFTETEAALVAALPNIKLPEGEIIKQIETRGWKDFKKTNHDVKAVELYIRHRLSDSSLADCLEWIHFALTSEDVNNLAYAMMLSAGIDILLEKLELVRKFLGTAAIEHAEVPMEGRTHGQAASSTSFGKEMRIFERRLERQIEQLEMFRLSVKLNGAVGNYNAHMAALPGVDWITFTRQFVDGLNRKFDYRFRVNLHTAQIEPHDNYADLFNILGRINTILIDFCQDMWRYISDGWIVLIPEAGEAGSSTMPNKVNPIDFENGEGNAGVANALCEFYARTLPVSRLQRHLSDSTIIRTFGVAIGHCLVAYSAVLNGLGKIRPDATQMLMALHAHPEVVAEAYQTILRGAGYPDPYEAVKNLTRGRVVTMADLHAFVDGLDVADEVRYRLKAVTPDNYLGLAAELARLEEVETAEIEP